MTAFREPKELWSWLGSLTGIWVKPIKSAPIHKRGLLRWAGWFPSDWPHFFMNTAGDSGPATWWHGCVCGCLGRGSQHSQTQFLATSRFATPYLEGFRVKRTWIQVLFLISCVGWAKFSQLNLIFFLFKIVMSTVSSLQGFLWGLTELKLVKFLAQQMLKNKRGGHLGGSAA